MAYSISYGAQRHELQKRPQSGRLWLLSAGFFALFLLGVQLFWADGAQALRQLIFPLSEQAVAALEGMVQSVRVGATIADAVTAFCREVIHGAQIA
jgi:hypothetical protein